MLCGKNVAYAKQGRGDVRCHCEPIKVDSIHSKNIQAKTVSSQISFFYGLINSGKRCNDGRHFTNRSSHRRCTSK